jgi:Dna[CI] antecedent, DciA
LDPLVDNVRAELSRLGPQAEIGRIAKAWPAAVGEQIARNAWPARIGRDGTLFVHTSSSTWAFELEQLAADIRKRLGELAPPKLRFAPGPLPEPETTDLEQSIENRPRPSAEDLDTASALAAEIEDEMLRKLVARAAAASLAKARSDRTF